MAASSLQAHSSAALETIRVGVTGRGSGIRTCGTMNWKPSCEMADRNGELGGLRISTLQEAVYIGTSRFVAALDPDRGEELWRTRLPHGGGTGKVVTLVLKGDRIYAGCGGYVYCLDKSTGRILWESGLRSMGHYAVMIAIEGAAPPPQDFVEGCRFEPRCGHCDEACNGVRPDFSQVGTTRRVACMHPLTAT